MSENTSKQESQEGVRVRKKKDAAEAAAPVVPPEKEQEVQQRLAEEHFDPSKLSRRVVDPKSSSSSRGPSQPLERLRTFADASATTDDFAALFEGEGGGAPKRQRFDLGDRVEGLVTHVDSRYIFVDLGGRGEARAPRAQYEDDEGNLEVTVGEPHEFVVLRFTAEGIELGKHMDMRQAGLGAIEDAEAGGMPVQGRVTSRNKGGFVVEIAGVEAFCPVSHIDLHNAEDLDVYLNQTFSFKVLEVRDGGRSVVVSRSELLREEAARQREETMGKLEPGLILTGTVRSISDFGAFVDLGGVDGLVHISEMSWGSVDKPSDVVSEGDQVEVKILDIEERPGKRPRIGLSMKQVQEDPWESVNEKLHVGMKARGKVVRTAPFGAFVEILPGVDGLVHVSEMSWEHVRRPSDVVSPGQEVEVEVLDIDLARQRISLSMKAAEGDPWATATEDFPVGDRVEGVVEKIEDFGVFINLGAGITALLPRSEMALGRNETPHSKARMGAPIEARVLRVEPERRRMALTLREDADDQDRRPRRDRPRKQKRQSQSRGFQDDSGGFGGTLGDLLKKKRDD